jgi:hypothetical protein
MILTRLKVLRVDILARDTEHPIYVVEGTKHLRYEVLTAVNMKITGTVLCDVTPWFDRKIPVFRMNLLPLSLG